MMAILEPEDVIVEEEEEEEVEPAPIFRPIPDAARPPILQARRPTPQIISPGRQIGGPLPPDVGVIGQMGSGFVQGLLHPLGFIDPVEKVLERINQASPEGLAETIGRGAGFFAGFLIPATPALKLGALATKGVGLAKTAEAFSDLGHSANLVRGLIGGTILGAGAAAEDGGDRVRNMVEEGLLFGIGDVIAPPLLRAIGRSSIVQAGKKVVDERLTKIARRGIVEDTTGSVAFGRALAAADSLFPEGQSVRIDNKRLRLLTGLDDLGLSEMRQGEVRMLRTVRQGGRELKKVLDVNDNIESRLVNWVDPRNGQRMADLVTVPKGQTEVLTRVAESLQKEGFFPGQQILYNGAKWRILGKTSGGDLRISPMAKTRGTSVLKTPDYAYLPLGVWETGGFSKSLRSMPELWSKFANKFGDFPDDGFDTAFAKFADDEVLDGVARQEAQEFFAIKQIEKLREIDEPLARSLQRLGLKKAGAHVEGSLQELAATQGFFVRETLNANNIPQIGLVDIREGSVIPFFSTERAKEFLQVLGRELGDVYPELQGNPLATNFMGLKGASVQVPHTAHELSAVNWPNWLINTKNVLPRFAWIRMMDDVAVEQMGVKAPRIFGTMADLQKGLNSSRLAQAPWLERLIKIRGTRLAGFRKFKGPIDPDRVFQSTELLWTPLKDWDRLAKLKGYTPKELDTMRTLIGKVDDQGSPAGFFDDLFKFYHTLGGPDIDAQQYFQRYYPAFRSLSSAEDWKGQLKSIFKDNGWQLDEKVVDFMSWMERVGQHDTRWEKDPFNIAIRYTRALFGDIYTKKQLKDMDQMITSLLGEGGVPKLVGESLKDYVTLTYGRAPEAYYVTRVMLNQTLEDLGIDMGPRDIERWVNGLIGLNYGAFMGFRPALALRNWTQTLSTTFPLLGAKYTGVGMKRAWSKAVRDEAIAEGAVLPRSIAAPFEDTIQKSRMAAQIERHFGTSKASGPLRAIEHAQELSQFSLGGTAKIGRFRIPVGLYIRADEVNRVTAYAGAKQRILDELTNWRGAKGHKDIAMFNRKSGLTMLGEGKVREFHRRLATEGEINAAKWIGVQIANETQWVYQLGAGPALFSSVPGRLFGMYGTWPTWYASHLARGMRMKGMDRAAFFGRSAILWGSLSTFGTVTAAGFGIGINTSRWSSLNSLQWTGSPLFDWFKDMTDIIGGVTGTGEATARRQLALGSRGLRDTGPGTGFHPIPGIPGSRVEVSDPRALLSSPLSFMVPGALQFKDILQASHEPTTAAQVLRFAGFKPVFGDSYPQLNISSGRQLIGGSKKLIK
jgi:hypothetical protein